MTGRAAAEIAFNLNQFVQPHLSLVAENGSLVETAPRPSDRFMGRVAIEALQAEYDAVTEFAELVDGQMRSRIELTFDGHDLYGEDGRSLTETAENGLQAAREQAKKNGNLWFEVGRRSLELEEIREAVEMFKTGEANTMVVTTDFPSALEGATEDVGGYNVTRKQALARFIVRRPDGSGALVSQTLDGSNRQALEAVHEDLGFRTERGELLGQRRFLNLTADEQATLADRSTGVYDREMAAQFGGEWFAGRRPVDYRNTYEFAGRQHDLIDIYKELKLSGNLTDDIMYDLAATLNERFKNYSHETHQDSDNAPGIKVGLTDHNAAAVYEEIMTYGRLARSAGKSFSGCGSTYKAEGADDSTDAQLENAGYGNRESKEWHGGKIHKNSKCVSCKEVKSEVGACRICKDCVEHPKSNVRTVQGRTGDPKKAKINKEPAKIFSLEEAREAREKRQTAL